jgi:putative transposase
VKRGLCAACPLDRPHLWAALRYAELNPVRAGMVAEPEAWLWSGAAAHCGRAEPHACLEMEMFRERWDVPAWRKYLAAGETEDEIAALRPCRHTGRLLGTPEFIKSLEQATRRQLVPQKGGRPGKQPAAAPGKHGGRGDLPSSWPVYRNDYD